MPRKKKEAEPEMTFFGSPYGPGEEAQTSPAPIKSQKRAELERLLMAVPSIQVRGVLEKMAELIIEIAKEER